MNFQQQTLGQLKELRLSTMAATYALQVQQPDMDSLHFDERLSLIVQAEVSARSSRAVARLVRASRLPDSEACIEDIDYEASRELDRSLIARLAQCNWLRSANNVFITGATGLGKTWLASALSHQACRHGFKVRSWKVAELCEKVNICMVDGSLGDLRSELLQPPLLVLDDFGIGTLSIEMAELLLRVADARQKTGSFLITSQYPVEKWHALFPDPTLADAFLDRTVHQAFKIALSGESMRKRRANVQMTEEEDAPAVQKRKPRSK